MHLKGFTIVELLIVIATIGILASIVVVSYRGVQNRAYDAAVQADLDNMAGLIESFKADPDSSDDFPPDKPALDTLGIKASKNSYDTTISRNLIYCVSSDYQAYKLVAASRSGSVFLMTQEGFATHSLTKADLTANFCANQGMTLGSEGMYQPNNWQTWVGNA